MKNFKNSSLFGPILITAAAFLMAAYIPFLVSSGADKIRIEAAVVAGPSGGACAVTEIGSSDWINGNASSGATGACTFSFNANVWTAAPSCQCTTHGGNTRNCSTSSAPTTSAWSTITFITSTGAAENNVISIMCVGQRP